MHTQTKAPVTRGRTIPWARMYDRLSSLLSVGRLEDLQKRMLDAAGDLAERADVLDVGCGTGSLLLAAKKRYGSGLARAVGIDPSRQMIQRATEKAQAANLDVEFTQAAIEALPFKDESFDLVLSTLMMHHLPDDVAEAGLREIMRALKPGGRLLVVDMQSQPGTFWQRMRDGLILLHGGHGKYDQLLTRLAEKMQAVGFKSQASGKINRQMSYVVSRKGA